MYRMYQYTIPNEYKHSVRRVATRSFYHFEVFEEDREAGTVTVRINAEQEVFERILQRAYCESLPEKEGVLTVTEEEAGRNYYSRCLMQEARVSSMEVIRMEDIPKLLLIKKE